MRVGFGLGDDLAHHLHRFERIAARGRFGREHHRVGAVVDRGRHIGGLGARRHRGRDHRLEHLGGHDHRLAGLAAGAHDALLDRRHLLGRHFHAQVAARHHHRIGFLDDTLQAVDRRRLLQLGDDPGPSVDDALDLDHVFGTLDEGQRHPVDTQLKAEAQVGVVLLGQRRKRQHHARHVHALAIGDGTAGDDARLGKIRAAGLDAQAHLAVVDQEIGAHFQRREDLAVRQRRAAGVARGRQVEVEAEAVAFLERHRAVGEGAEAELGPLQVHQDADRAAEFALDLADDLVVALVIGVRAVAEVEAEDVGSGFEQRLDGFLGVAGRAERGHDLGITFSVHFLFRV